MISRLVCQEAGHGCWASAADTDDIPVAAEQTSFQWV